jgi:hypothetical protein
MGKSSKREKERNLERERLRKMDREREKEKEKKVFDKNSILLLCSKPRGNL